MIRVNGRPGADSTFIQQFLRIFASNNAQSIISKYLEYDAAMGELDDHLAIIFNHLRARAIQALRDLNLPAMNDALATLVAIVTEPLGTQSFIRTQRLTTEAKSGLALKLAAQTDSLLPFFSLHPADFILAPKLVRPDLSSPQAVYTMQSEFNSLMTAIDTTTVRIVRTASHIAVPHTPLHRTPQAQGVAEDHPTLVRSRASRRRRTPQIQPELWNRVIVRGGCSAPTQTLRVPQPRGGFL